METFQAAIAKLEVRQEATIQAVNRVLDALETQTELLHDLLDWANQPASSDLPDALKALATAVREIGDQIHEHRRVAETVGHRG